MIDVEVFGLRAERSARRGSPSTAGRGSPSAARDLPGEREVRDLCAATAERARVHDGHLAVAFVDAARIAALNAAHRDEPRPTDVLSFPIDGPTAERADRDTPERELGDVVICAEHCSDVRAAIVHGVLHLLGMDHEGDDGEMLALQREVLASRAGGGTR